MMRVTLALMCVLLVLPSCSRKLEGEKKPTVENATLTYCNSELQGFVVRGTGLSPMVVDGAKEDERLEMPDVCLKKTDGSDAGPCTSGTKTADGACCVPDEDVQWVSQNEIHFSLRSSLGLTPGTYDAIITNPDGSRASGSVQVIVLPGEFVIFWSDPNIVYNGISTQVTIYGTNLADIETVAIRENTGGTETPLTFAEIGDRENRVQATIPQGTAVPGNPDADYQLVVRTTTGCEAMLDPGVRITDTLGLTLTDIDPSFGDTMSETPVTITGEGFQQVPRAYLNPVNPAPGSVASALSSLAMIDDTGTTLTAVVPSMLPEGSYDLVVVNPDGRVGVLDRLPDFEEGDKPGAFQVVANPPPVVDNVSPNFVEKNPPVTVTVEGSGFNAPEVDLFCRLADGTEQNLDATVAEGSATAFDVTLPVDTLTEGTVCVLRVTNADGSYFDYSAIGIANPSLNLTQFLATNVTLQTARRAPAVVAARATHSARFVYAIGGDDGSTPGALSSVETLAIDVFGQPRGIFTQPAQGSLPGPRTLAGVTRIDRFLYLVGGNDGSGPTDSVLRAQVLDPSAAPVIEDVTARKRPEAEPGGVENGVWYYRVSAVMADDDPSNPGGETLASDPIAVTLQDREGSPLYITVYWTPVDNAKAYRVYRSPTGTETLDGVRFVAEVASPGNAILHYEDVSASGGTMDTPPLPVGATGVWMALPDLGTAREAPGVAAGQDPDDPTKWYLYALGGRAAAPLATTERLDITVSATGQQSFTTWTAGDELSAARAELTGYRVSHSEAAQVPAGTTYIYAGGGVGSNNVDSAEVVAGGALTWASAAASAMTPPRSGYGGVAGAGFLFAFGGLQTAPDDTNASAEIDLTTMGRLRGWTSQGEKLGTPRYLTGGAVESAVIFIIGGATSGGAATNAIEKAVL